MKKKLTGILAAMALATALAACGGLAKTSETQAPETSATAAETVQTSEDTETAAAEEETAAVETDAAQTQAAVSFETTDLEGNPVSSADIFSQHKLTMVNVWGTFCGPCIGEMPDLEVLNGRLAEKDCAIIGLVCDVRGPNDTDTIEAAKEIVAETGVTYLNLLPFSEMNRIFPAMYIPTTYFVDENGQIVGEEAVGARGADDYEALVDKLLEGM